MSLLCQKHSDEQAVHAASYIVHAVVWFVRPSFERCTRHIRSSVCPSSPSSLLFCCLYYRCIVIADVGGGGSTALIRPIV